MRRWLKARLAASTEALRRNRWLKPLAPALAHPNLWHLNRRAVAGGVAVGLFFGLLVPVAQILGAAVAAVWLRVNLPVAALSTLVTNPLTFAPIYYLAYRIGVGVVGSEAPAAARVVEEGVQALSGAGWLEYALGVGKPLVVGLAILAVGSAATGYLVVSLAWRAFTLARLMRKRRGRREPVL